MKRNLITLLGVVAIVVAIVVVRSMFQQTIQSEEAAREAAEAARNLAAAAEITEDAKAKAGTAAETGELPPVEPVQSAPLEGFEEIAWTDAAPESFMVKFDSDAGSFVIECHTKWAPEGAKRFYELCKLGFFNDAGFFRVVPGFVVQFGLASDPRMTALYNNKNLRDEPVRKSNQKGMVSYAAGGPNTRTTQVFINYGDNNQLDGMGFAPFGQVIAGMENVEKINAEYGERPDQGMIKMEGSAYLRQDFPELDFITKTTLVKKADAAAAAPATPAPADTPAPTPGE